MVDLDSFVLPVVVGVSEQLSLVDQVHTVPVTQPHTHTPPTTSPTTATAATHTGCRGVRRMRRRDRSSVGGGAGVEGVTRRLRVLSGGTESTNQSSPPIDIPKNS